MFNTKKIKYLEDEIKELRERYWELERQIFRLEGGLNTAGVWFTKSAPPKWVKRDNQSSTE